METLFRYLEGLDDTKRGLEIIQGADESEGESGFLNHSSKSQRGMSVYNALRNEIHEFLCTKSKKYTNLRASAELNSRAVVAYFAALASRDFGATVATASSIAAVSLFIPLKIGVAAFCRAYATSPNEMTDIERLETRKKTKP